MINVCILQSTVFAVILSSNITPGHPYPKHSFDIKLIKSYLILNAMRVCYTLSKNEYVATLATYYL